MAKYCPTSEIKIYCLCEQISLLSYGFVIMTSGLELYTQKFWFYDFCAKPQEKKAILLNLLIITVQGASMGGQGSSVQTYSLPTGFYNGPFIFCKTT